MGLNQGAISMPLVPVPICRSITCRRSNCLPFWNPINNVDDARPTSMRGHDDGNPAPAVFM